ncbi:MAG TPA: hypothetical protein VM536_21860 [Chloroflexia bacterium]|nr:hypothetical protein [Chloroflexia bacterium]
MFHLIFTVRVVGRCLGDPRVAGTSKALFIAIMGLLMAAVIIPEAAADVLALLVPFAGPALDLVGIPFEGVADWSFLVLVLGSLVSLFPPDVLRQHIVELQGGHRQVPTRIYPPAPAHPPAAR